MSKKIIGLAIVALVVSATAVNAGVITQTIPFSGTPSYSSTLTFNKFDNQGGTLTLQSVFVSVNLNANGGALRLDNDATTPASGSVEFGAEASISSSVSMIDAGFMQIFQAGDIKATGGAGVSLGADDGDAEVGGTPFFSYAGTDYGNYAGGAVSDGDFGNVNSLVFGQYIGTGTFTVTVNTSQVANYGSLGGVFAQIDPLTTSGSFTVEYNYIPEPATAALLAIGGLLFVRRRSAC